MFYLSHQDGDSSDDDGSEHGSPHTSPPHRGHNQHHRRKPDKKKRRWGKRDVLTVQVSQCLLSQLVIGSLAWLNLLRRSTASLCWSSAVAHVQASLTPFSYLAYHAYYSDSIEARKSSLYEVTIKWLSRWCLFTQCQLKTRRHSQNMNVWLACTIFLC